MHPSNAITVLRTATLDRSSARDLQRRHRTGELVRVRHGVYVETAAWDVLDGRARHLVRMRAVLPLVRTGSMWALDSAGAVLGVPRIDPWPTQVRVFAPDLDSDRSRVGLTMHAERPRASGLAFHGVEVTELAQTVVGLARRGSLGAAVVALDHALRSGVPEDDLRARSADAGPWGAARVDQALRLADARHESVGESWFAARAGELGLRGLVPQHVFVAPDGTVDRVDFWLPGAGVIVEFDGRQKYDDPEMLQGRTASDVVWAEKIREDRLRVRPEVRTVVRPRWWHLVDAERLRALFRAHGVRCR
ncbi:hypothetical protein [Curtobacterium oceanosedimentum]|uniref:hypothetical protein n=1 Tax=Curtobacterium oceanosedimentum TaxID=465820 RepID=UPI000736AC2E|nr:hypothetical protein [Curtobacterium oceanosedimentum]